MRIVVVGGSGHIGTYLVPRLVRGGHDVVSISRGSRRAYADAPEWREVEQVAADRTEEDREGTFGRRIVDLKPDAVIDLLCFTVESAQALVDGIRGNVAHLVHCGSLWRYGPAQYAPIAEGEGTPALEEYGLQKDAIARLLQAETAAGGLVTTSLHPGHIAGPGWAPIGPLGNRDPRVWQTLSAGETLRMPGSGAEFMHHVHADDVAQLFALAVENRDAAAGEDFHAVAATAVNVNGLAQIGAGWFGQEARLESIGWDRFEDEVGPDLTRTSWGHLHRNHVLSIEKSARVLGYRPRYRPEEAVLQGLRTSIESGEIVVPNPLVV
jgi:nucleoside-diphosphate-sugar epimerase